MHSFVAQRWLKNGSAREAHDEIDGFVISNVGQSSAPYAWVEMKGNGRNGFPTSGFL